MVYENVNVLPQYITRISNDFIFYTCTIMYGLLFNRKILYHLGPRPTPYQ